MSEPTASDLAALVRASVAFLDSCIRSGEPMTETAMAMKAEGLAALDALVARVDTLTRERDEQKAWIDRVAQTSTDAATAAEGAEQRAEAAENALAEATREKENDAWAARESVRVAHDALVAKEVAESALARAEEFIQSDNWIKKSDHEAALADTRRALEEIDARLPVDADPYDGTANQIIRDIARRALAAGDKT